MANIDIPLVRVLQSVCVPLKYSSILVLYDDYRVHLSFVYLNF